MVDGDDGVRGIGRVAPRGEERGGQILVRHRQSSGRPGRGWKKKIHAEKTEDRKRERENVGTCRNFEHQNERSMERETERERQMVEKGSKVETLCWVSGEKHHVATSGGEQSVWR